MCVNCKILIKLLVISLLGLAATARATPHIQQWQAPSGANVLFVENHDLPMLDVSVSFPAGSGYDTADKAGLASMTQGMLDHGSDGMNEDQVASRLADIGASLGGGVDMDRAVISLRTLSSEKEREAALKILSSVLQQPQFPEDILAREKSRLIAALKEADTKPESIASRAFSSAVYGNHPYGLRTAGEVDTVTKLQRSDLEAFYRSHYVAKTAIVALMGDITRAQAEAIAQQLTSRLPADGASAQLPQVAPLQAASMQRIAHPATQSHILIGATGISRSDPDYFTLYVGNYIFGGGGFVSRLMQEVREKRGMAYNVYSYFMPMMQAGAFQIGLQTRKDQADEALEVVNETLRKFIAQGPTEKELIAARENIINGFPLRIDSNRKILDYLSVIGFYHLPLTYLDDFSDKVRKVTTAEIRAAFKRKINPDKLATVIVGAPEEKGAAQGEAK